MLTDEVCPLPNDPAGLRINTCGPVPAKVYIYKALLYAGCGGGIGVYPMDTVKTVGFKNLQVK